MFTFNTDILMVGMKSIIEYDNPVSRTTQWSLSGAILNVPEIESMHLHFYWLTRSWQCLMNFTLQFILRKTPVLLGGFSLFTFSTSDYKALIFELFYREFILHTIKTSH